MSDVFEEEIPLYQKWTVLYFMWDKSEHFKFMSTNVILDAWRNSASVILKALTCHMFCMYN